LCVEEGPVVTIGIDSAAPARECAVRRPSEFEFVDDHASEPGDGVRVATILGPQQGAVHLAVAVVEIAAGGVVAGHRHPFEESYFVLEGHPLVAIADKRYALGPEDFALMPYAAAHAWRNPGTETVRLLRVQTPQPRPVGGRGAWGVFDAPDLAVPLDGTRPWEGDPAKPFAGHFEESDMAPPGSILMPGYHGANVRNVQVRMMVDELLGARQHSMFIVQFRMGATAKAASEHFHPFEEAFYLLSGTTRTSFDGTHQLATAGDIIFAPVGASHGFTPVSDEPVRWVEIQSPQPPASGGFIFHVDWADHRSLG
jgi:quercetin dioxygenase-like cupin family protein